MWADFWHEHQPFSAGLASHSRADTTVYMTGEIKVPIVLIEDE